MLSFKQSLYRYYIGLNNKLKYGKNGPEFGELIYINPQNHKSILQLGGRINTSRVIGGDWDLGDTTSFENHPKFIACKLRWMENVSWEETGIYDYMLKLIQENGPVDGVHNLKEIILRYKKLDEVFKEVKRTRKFKTQKELNPNNFNEYGGLFFHIDRNNNPIFGGGGLHRLSMAKILKLEIIPAQLGVVHSEAIKTWKLHKSKSYRLKKELNKN